MLWFGWFGFNAGSALSAGHTAALAMINTQIATAAAVLSWVGYEKLREGKATTLGAASGAIAGAVGITPACGFVTPLGALLIGLTAGVVSAYGVSLKYKLNYDDSLDVVGVHGLSGIVGMLSIGLIATLQANPLGADGLFYSGSTGLLQKQFIASLSVLAYSFIVTYLIATGIQKTIGFRVHREVEIEGVDTAIHAESAYEFNR
jgi:Amt family ammonium transporter